MARVTARNLWKTYDGHVVLENVNLEVAEREFVTIVGASGCGKTTFLKMLLGMETPSKGQLLIDGKPIVPEPTAERGIVFQRYSLFPHLTVLQNVLLWLDTWASLERIGLALAISAAIGLVFGVATGVIPLIRATLAPFIAALSMIPPLAILPILFIVMGLGEVAKITLIVIGVTPVIVRDLALRAGELPREQLIKAQTLGASTWQLILRVVLPQIWPRLLDSLRLTLGSAWLFLIAAEAIASTEGLGYRIFLVRRYLAMDVILPYVVWITALAFAMDWTLKWIRSRACPWAEMAH
jgi:NitT/TauT family transport system permease protein